MRANAEPGWGHQAPRLPYPRLTRVLDCFGFHVLVGYWRVQVLGRTDYVAADCKDCSPVAVADRIDCLVAAAIDRMNCLAAVHTDCLTADIMECQNA